MRIYRFHWDCGRMGDIDGLFAVNDAGFVALESLYGRDIYFGEVLGKHSDVWGTLERNEVTQVDATPEDVAVVLQVLNCAIRDDGWVTISGFNPLDYRPESDPDDE